MRRNHQYYFQIQHPVLIIGFFHVYFYVWTPSTEADNFLFVDVGKDPELREEMLEKFNTLFMKCILPELLTRRNDPSNENSDQYYCFCRRPSFPPMIACSHRDCKWEWFHYSCVGVKKAPMGRWFCKYCKTL